jgi:hypothetical protein
MPAKQSALLAIRDTWPMAATDAQTAMNLLDTTRTMLVNAR